LNSNEAHSFNLLIQRIEATFLRSNTVSSNIKDWKGEDIVAFQEDLLNKANARVSEKWFYTYIKNTPEKLPRIDILNLLSKYVGEENWNTFQANNIAQNRTNKYRILFLGLLILSVVIYAVTSLNSKNTFEFCFIDAVKNEPISSIPLDIIIIKSNESPLYYKTDSLGCFSYTTKDEQVKFVIQSPYHKTDTITRNINTKNNTVRVRPDDYALMMYYYANTNIKDWKNHSNQLNNLIDDNAKIYRLFRNKHTVEVYSKQEFINMLTIPTERLKRTEILKKTIKNGKIVTLKFIVK